MIFMNPQKSDAELLWAAVGKPRLSGQQARSLANVKKVQLLQVKGDLFAISAVEMKTMMRSSRLISLKGTMYAPQALRKSW